MRNLVLLAGMPALLGLSACGTTGLDRDRPDEFAVARQAPLVIPPDFALEPPQPGAARPQQAGAQDQALEALFGGPAQRSATEQAVLGEAGADTSEAGVRSEVGDAQTDVVDKGTTTQDIIAAPEGDGQDARAGIPQ